MKIKSSIDKNKMKIYDKYIIKLFNKVINKVKRK